MVELDRHRSADREAGINGISEATVHPPRDDFSTQSYHLQLSAPLKLSVAQHSALLLQHSFDTGVFY